MGMDNFFGILAKWKCFKLSKDVLENEQNWILLNKIILIVYK